MVQSLSEIWSAAATPPLWLSSQLTVGKEHPLVRPAQPKAKAPPLAAHSKWRRPISKMTHYRLELRPNLRPFAIWKFHRAPDSPDSNRTVKLTVGLMVLGVMSW